MLERLRVPETSPSTSPSTRRSLPRTASPREAMLELRRWCSNLQQLWPWQVVVTLEPSNHAKSDQLLGAGHFLHEEYQYLKVTCPIASACCQAIKQIIDGGVHMEDRTGVQSSASSLQQKLQVGTRSIFGHQMRFNLRALLSKSALETPCGSCKANRFRCLPRSASFGVEFWRSCCGRAHKDRLRVA